MVKGYDIKEMFEEIMEGEENQEITLDLKDLVWTILIYQDKLHDTEQEIYDALDGRIIADIHWLKTMKECYASRSDELIGIIMRYTNFDTQKIWKKTMNIHKETKTYGY